MKPRHSTSISTLLLITTGLVIGLLMLWWQPLQPAGPVAVLASAPFIVLARAVHPWSAWRHSKSTAAAARVPLHVTARH